MATVKAQLRTTCPLCGQDHFVDLDEEQYEKYLTAQRISDIPRLSTDERELLISGICSECWDRELKPTEQ